MPVSYNFKKGTDLPSWHWLNQFPPAATVAGNANAWDGSRYMYWIMGGQGLWRFDTWTNGWHFIVSTGLSIATGTDVEYDSVRNVLWIAQGNNTGVWNYFNLNATAITLAGVTTNPFTLSANIAVGLPVGATTAATLCWVDDTITTAPVDGTGRTVNVATSASTAGSLVDANAEYQGGLVGLFVRMTSGALSGQQRVITAVPSQTTLTLGANLSGTPGAGDTFVIETPGGTNALAATGGSTTTLVMTGAAFPTNAYRDADVVIVAGTGSGQRRRIASNDGTTLTLAASVTGNARTGPFATAPDATSTFRIVPSSDFLYFFVGTTSMYRVDIAATTLAFTTFATVPAAPGAGSNAIPSPNWAPFSIVLARGANTATIYRYDVGPQTWATLNAWWGAEVLGGGAAITRAVNRTRLLVHIAGTSRMYLYNVVTGLLEPIPALPYAVPTAVDGKRARWVRTADGVDFIYLLRPGGQEFFRIPVEWL